MPLDASHTSQELLVSGLAHRMNNILTVFNGYVGLMLENQGLDAATRDGLSRIRAGARAATELMDRTHALVRRPNIAWREMEPADFLRLIRPAVEAVRKPGPALEFQVGDGLPKVWIDSTRLRNAILELVRNSVEAIGDKEGQVRLTLARATALGEEAGDCRDRVALAVIDNGPGISPEVEAKMYQPFYSTKRKQNANGLGLNVARELVGQCGGILRHESRPGATKFEILLRTRPAGVS